MPQCVQPPGSHCRRCREVLAAEQGERDVRRTSRSPLSCLASLRSACVPCKPSDWIANAMVNIAATRVVRRHVKLRGAPGSLSPS